MVATAVHAYKDGVIDRILPRSGMPLPPDWVLQNPADWLEGWRETLHQVLQKSGISGEEVIGLGIDFTACTVLPTTAFGTRLIIESFTREGLPVEHILSGGD